MDQKLQRETPTDTKGDKKIKERERESVCVCV